VEIVGQVFKPDPLVVYHSRQFSRTAEVAMRLTLLLVCALPLLLAACGSSSRQDGPASLAGYAKPASGSTQIRGDYASYPAAQAFVDRMAAEGFDPAEVADWLSRAQRQQWIIDFVHQPQAKPSTAPTGAWTRYRAKFLTEANITKGANFWGRYERELRRAQDKYGVPPEYVVAIIGVETNWGGYMGKHRVMDALVTLAFDFPRRSDYFTDELAAYLRMARGEGMDPFQPKGSYAGAMGYGQFMPSSYLKWAVEFDGDGRRDLWNPVDAIGSVANYFAEHGWRAGEPVAVLTGASGNTDLKTGFDTRYDLGTLARAGFRPDGRVPAGEQVSLIRLDATGGYQYWLGLNNFYVITRYNHSSYYAMAVHQLAQAIRARRGSGPDTRLSGLEAGLAPPL
jgi:membrane-bound lytic murein transglycosylase B